MGLGVEQVHRPAFALGAAGGFAEHFGHGRAGRHAHRQACAVAAIAGHQVIAFFIEESGGADGNGFLPAVEMAEPANLLARLGVFDVSSFFKPTNEHHHAQALQSGLAIDGGLAVAAGRGAVDVFFYGRSLLIFRRLRSSGLSMNRLAAEKCKGFAQTLQQPPQRDWRLAMRLCMPSIGICANCSMRDSIARCEVRLYQRLYRKAETSKAVKSEQVKTDAVDR